MELEVLFKQIFIALSHFIIVLRVAPVLIKIPNNINSKIKPLQNPQKLEFTCLLSSPLLLLFVLNLLFFDFLLYGKIDLILLVYYVL